ncbi:MAG: hypothetical protein NT078_00215 [Candidatus Azambacteria bacterium]|nr:hypothetical protein [Candidatus Azambacteria bacterium]
MFKWFIGLLASVSSIFTTGANKSNVAPPLNTAIIAYQETYYAPVVADPENFPWVKSIKLESQTIKKETTPAPVAPTPTPLPPQQTTPTPPAEPQDPYLANPEPITTWLSMNLTLRGNSNDSDNPRTLPEITFDREYWRMEIFAYWAPDVIPPKPDMQNDYFKLEVYEKGTDKLVYTMTSGSNESIHKFQSFRKPGIFYFKAYTKNPSEWEMSFTASSKIAQ